MPTKDEIKNWLKSKGKSREWLAEQLLSSKASVDKWLSTNRDIPAKHMIQIMALMEKESESEYKPIELSADVKLKLTSAEYSKFAVRANEAGMSIEQWIAFALDYAGQHADVIFKEIMDNKPDAN